MFVYWSFFALTIIMMGIYYVSISGEYITKDVSRKSHLYAGITFVYICLICGLRDAVLDTTAYINEFNHLSKNFTDFLEIIKISNDKRGFILIEYIFKRFISDNYYMWLVFLCSISCICLYKGFCEYSEDLSFTMYLFVASTTFTWLINGMRQFVAVCILFAFSNLWREGKKIKYIILILLVSTIHISAILVIPVYMIASNKKIWDKRMILFMIATIVGTYYSEKVFAIFNNMLLKDYSESLSASSGSNFMRLLVAFVPIFLVIITKKYVEEISDEKIRFCINMSLVNFCFYFASTFTSGILVGRMPIYFSIYNLCLLPWLIENCFTRQSRVIAKVGCIICYSFYFYYQMVIAWHGLKYESIILHLNL